MPKKLNFEFVKNFIEDEGYVFLSDKYVNTETKLIIQCKKGHIFKPTFHNFKDSGSRCPICSNQKNIKHTIEYVKNIFNKYGYKLEINNYKNNKQKLKTI